MEKLTRYLNFLEQDPKNLNLLLSLSDCYRQIGDFKSAQGFLDKAKLIDCEACFVQQGLIDIHLGNYKEAKEILGKALKNDDSLIIRYSLALCHYSLMESEEGIKYLDPLRKSNNLNQESALLLAKLLRQQGNLDDAIYLLQSSIEFLPHFSEGFALLAEIYFDCQNFEVAERAARQALANSPDNQEAQTILLLIQLAEGNSTSSEIENLLKRKPEKASLWFALGSTFMRERKMQKAKEAFLKAAELEPLFLDNWISLGWCQLCQNQIQNAEACYQQVVKIDEQSPEGWGGLALVQSLYGEFEDAGRLIAKAKQLDPQCLTADIAQIIQKNDSDPLQAGANFRSAFPSLAAQINAAMERVLFENNFPIQ